MCLSAYLHDDLPREEKGCWARTARRISPVGRAESLVRTGIYEILLAAFLSVTLGCSGSQTMPSPSATATPWIATASLGVGTNNLWVTAKSVDERSAFESAIAQCEKRAGAPCTSSVGCPSPRDTWAGLARELRNGSYSYRLDCNRAVPDDVINALRCDACELLWGPTLMRD
jgi:hypothetical protein